jgi:phosphate transport system substrate-binding protein
MQLSGSPDVVSLADLIQVACTNRRRARVRLSAGNLVGVMHLADGEVVHASFGGLEGNRAVYAALTTSGLAYQVDPDMPAPWRNVEGTAPQLLLEAARLADEGWTPVPPEPASRVGRDSSPPDGWQRETTSQGWQRETSSPLPVSARRDTMGTPVASAPRRRTGVMVLAGGLAAIAAVGVSAWIVSRQPGAAPAAVAGAALPGPAADARTVEAADLTGPGDEPPRLTEGAPAVRPAVDLALTPTVVCRLRIDTSGAVVESKVFRSRLDLAAFEDAALLAVSHYRFRPARDDGELVSAWINWPVTFRERGQTAALRIKGSDTIGGKLGPALARAFEQRRPDVTITIEALGSSTAFVGLFDGSADLGASSRPVNQKEIAEARRLSVRLSEIVIGYDGLAVIVHRDNPIESLSIDDASRLFRGEIQSWKELGGPDRPVHRISRPTYSGTYEFFRDKVVRRGDAKAPGELAADTRVIESNHDIAAAVAADPGAVSYLGLGWAKGGVRAVPIRPGASRTAIAPTASTVRDGSYPIYRTLLVYSRGAPRGDAAAFLGFALSPEGQAIVEEQGFVGTGPGGDAELARLVASGTDASAPADTAPTLALRVEFQAGASQLGAAGKAELRALARQARAARQRLLVIGNADAEGARTSHEQVSAARARAVADALIAGGVPADRITTEAAGSTKPLESNATRTGRSHNRRVDVFVLK